MKNNSIRFPWQLRSLALVSEHDSSQFWRTKDPEGAHSMVKVVCASVLKQNFLYSRFCSSLEIQSHLNHPNIVRLVDFKEVADWFFLRLELCSVSLQQIIDKQLECGRFAMSYSSLRSIARQLFRALAYLHANGVLHRDVKPSNILLSGSDRSESMVVKLSDFGSCVWLGLNREGLGLNGEGLTNGKQDENSPNPLRALGVDKRCKTYVGCTLEYMAPEIVAMAQADVEPNVEYGYSFPADVYAAGITLVELLHFSNPYVGLYEFLKASTSELPATSLDYNKTVCQGIVRSWISTKTQHKGQKVLPSLSEETCITTRPLSQKDFLCISFFESMWELISSRIQCSKSESIVEFLKSSLSLCPTARPKAIDAVRNSPLSRVVSFESGDGFEGRE